ncbi:MAG: Phospho-N-acetylmuramoyl-pentapeptide-transferase [Chlamydiia bacterium]|nr:Phospho-N-acetylmuramoyl-pentapeptide-transferase [Chlamydiia bacterium]
MLLHLLHWLQNQGVQIPHVFFYTTSKMMLAALSSFALTLVVGKVFIAKLVSLKIGHRVRVADCKALAGSYTKGENIPSMGGVLFIFSIIISNMLWMSAESPFFLLFSFTLLSMGAIGFADDFLKVRGHKNGLSARVKFALQFLSVFFIALYLHNTNINHLVNSAMQFSETGMRAGGIQGSFPVFMKYIYIPFCKSPWIFSSTILMFIFTMFVMVGTSNAVNLTDGLDGLATGCMLLVAAVFAIIAFVSGHVMVADYLNILYVEGAGEIAIFLSSMIGGLLGFLWFNSYPAQVFMGDTGSLALGGAVALASVLLRREFLLALTGGIFVIETLSVILQVLSFRFLGRRIFSCAPIHHHFEIKGWHESKIVIRFWMIGIILALAGLISLKIQ